MEGVSNMSYDLCYFFDIEVNQILTEHGILVKYYHDCFPWVFQTCGSHHQYLLRNWRAHSMLPLNESAHRKSGNLGVNPVHSTATNKGVFVLQL